jgi:H-type lectin domain
MSSDAGQSYYQESGPTCGQRNTAEQEVRISSTKNVTWTPLLRKITLGLKALDTDKSTNVRVLAKANNIKPDGATIDVTTWHDTKFYAGDADYISWGDCNTSLEFGTLDTYNEGLSKKVKFERCYAVPPIVVVFFHYLDLETTGDAWRVTAYTQDVTATGFTVGARTWASSQIHSVGVSWIAVPATSSVFRAGTYSTSELHPWSQPAQTHSKSLAFSSPIRDNLEVFTGLNHINMSTAQNLRIRLNEDKVSGKGFTWYIDAWSDTKINEAGVSFLAF